MVVILFDASEFHAVDSFLLGKSLLQDFLDHFIGEVGCSAIYIKVSWFQGWDGGVGCTSMVYNHDTFKSDEGIESQDVFQSWFNMTANITADDHSIYPL